MTRRNAKDERPAMTGAQRKVYDAIRDFLAKEKIAPSLDDLRNATGAKSKNSIVGHLKNLERDGYIQRRGRTARGIVVIEPEAK